MNKIFKVLWNRARGTHVVTDETRTSHGKGRQGAATIDQAPRAALLAAAAALTFGTALPAWATEITKPIEWGHTTITQSGNVWNVTTDRYVNNGQTGINRFDKFTIDQGHIANLQMGQGSQLLNLVNQHITVNGVVNAVKDNKIGGDLIFVSPSGMTVGSTGVINAGSLSAVAVSNKEFLDMVTDASLDVTAESRFTADYLNRLSAGEVPLNPAGVITVAGSINAGNRVALAARTVKIESGALVRTGVADFSALVNVKDETGAVTADSGLSAADGNLEFAPDPDSGDILLVARADASASGILESLVGDGTTEFGTIEAEVVVEKDATVDASRDAVIRAEAGSGEYDVLTGEFAENTAKHSDDVKASVSIAGNVSAGRDVDVSAKAHNQLEHKSTFNLAAVSENIQGAFLGGFAGSTVEWVDMSASAEVNVADTAAITAERNASVTADTVLDLSVGDSTGFLNYTNIGSSIPIVAVAAAQADASSKVTIAGAVKAGEDVTIGAKTDFVAQVKTKATVKGQQTELSFVYADLSSTSEVEVADTAEIGAVEGDASLGDVKITAETTNRVETAAETAAYRTGGGSIGIAGNVTLFDSSSTLNMNSGLDAAASTIDIAATNTTETFDVLSKTTTGDNGVLLRYQAKAVEAALDKVLGPLAEKVKGAGGAGRNLSFNLGGAAAYVESSQTADVTLQPGDEALRASGDVNIASNAYLGDYHYEVSTKQVIDETSSAKRQGAVAVLVSDSDVSADLTVGDGSVLESTGANVNVASSVEINKDRWQFLVNEYISQCDTLLSYFGADGPFADKSEQAKTLADNLEAAFKGMRNPDDPIAAIANLSNALNAFTAFLQALPGDAVGVAGNILGTVVDIGFDLFDIVNPASYTNTYVSAGGATKDATDAPVSVAASVGVVSQSANSTVTIGRGASITGKDVTVSSSSTNEGVAMGGYLNNMVGVPLPNLDNAKALGATVVHQSFTGGSSVEMLEGSTINASGSASVTSEGSVDAVTVAASAGLNKGGLTLSGLAAVTEAEGENLISIDDEASISAEDDLTVSAVRDDSIQTVAGGINIGTGGSGSANASVGAGVAVNLGGLTNALEVKDIDGSVNQYHVAGSLTGDTVSLLADADANVNAIGVEGQAAISSSGSGDAQTDASEQLENLGLGEYTDDIVTADDMNDVWSSTQSQNGFDSDMDWVEEGSSSSGRPAGSTPDISSGTAKADASNQASSSKNSLNLAAAGSFAWNDFNLGNTVTIDSSGLENDGVFTVNASTLAVEALTDKWMGSFAGAAGISAVTGGSTTVNGSIGGAAAINKNSFTNSVTINGLKTTADTMSVASLVNGTTVAEGLGLAVAAGQSTAALGIDAGVSYNDVENTVSTSVSGLVNESSGEFVYDQAAWTGETQVTGGTAVGGAAGKTTFSGSAGAAVAVADIANNVSSTLADSNLTNAKSVDVAALASLTQVNTAVSAQVAAGGSYNATLSGAVISAGIDNIVSANVTDTAITVADGGSVDVRAATASTGEGGEAAGYAKRVQGIDGIVSRGDLIDAALTEGVTLKEDQSDDSAHDITAEYLNGADMTQVSVALGVGAAVGSGSSGGAAAGVVVTDLANDFSAMTENLSVTQAADGADFTYAQTAASGVSTVNVAAGIAASGGSGLTLGLAGSVVVSGVEQTTRAEASGLTLELGEHAEDEAAAAIGAQNDASTVNVAGNVSAAISANGAGIGAGVVVADVANTAETALNGARVKGGGIFAVTARNDADTWAAAANAVVSSRASIGGSYAQNRVTNNAGVTVDNAKLQGLDAFAAQAEDGSLLRTLSGSVSVSYSPDGSASLSGGVAMAEAGGTTDAEVANLTILGEGEAGETDVSVTAEASDDIRTLTLGTSVAALGVGAGNATAINRIDRSVSAALDGLTTENAAGGAWTGDRLLGAVDVAASSDADISNLGIVIGVGALGVGGGVGVALNDVAVDVSSSADGIVGTLDTFEVAASSANEINTIGIGVNAGGAGAVGGSGAEANIGGDVSAQLTDSNVTADGAVAVHAESDDTVGLYGGQAAGSATVAIGVTVGLVERTGSTLASIADSTIRETGVTDSKLLAAGGVTDGAINDDVAEDVSLAASLSQERTDQVVDGILVSATSTSTYKALVINGAGSAGPAGTGSGLSITHGGATSASATNSNLASSAETVLLAGDYANFFTSLTNVGGSGTAMANLGVALVETTHATSAEAEESQLEGEAVRLEAESKEGVSSLMIAGSGATTAAGAATTAKTDLKSTVSSALRSSTVTGTNYTQSADYLGRISNLGVAAALAANPGGSGAVGVNLALNSADNRVSTEVEGSTVSSTGEINVDAHRALELKEYGGAAAAAVGEAAVAAAGTVAVNTIEGETAVKISDGSSVGTDETERTTISAGNDDSIDILQVTAGISTSVAAGVTVVVNEIADTAGVLIENASAKGKTLSAKAEQNRTVTGTIATAAAGLWGGVSANVVATTIGEKATDYASLFGGEEGAGEQASTVTGLVGEYADYDKSTLSGLAPSATASSESNAAANSAPANSGESLLGGANGTKVILSNANLSGTDVSVRADEDASGTGVNLTLGGGSAAGVLAANAGVAVLERHHNAGVEMTGGSITASNALDMGASTHAVDLLTVWQAGAGLVSGTAAYAESNIEGSVGISIENADVTSENALIAAENASSTTIDSNGIAAGGVAAGGMIAKIHDASDVSASVKQTTFTGSTSIAADRGQTLAASALAGYGGAAAGVGAAATVLDDGDSTVTLEGAAAKRGANAEAQYAFSAEALQHAQLSVDAMAAGGALGAAVGVVQGSATASGTVSVDITGGSYETDEASFAAFAGEDTGYAQDALSLTGEIQGYGGALIAGVGVNQLNLVNNTQTNLTMTGADFGEETDVEAKAGGHASYSGHSDAIYAGIVASGTNHLSVEHGAQTSMTLTGASGGTSAGSFTALAQNSEDVSLTGESAGGGLVSIEGVKDAVKVSHADTSSATISAGGVWTIADRMDLAAATISDVRLTADNTKGGLGVLSGASAENTQTGETSVTIEDGASISAGGDISISAETDWSIAAAEGDYVVASEVYGGLTGNGIGYTGTIDRGNTIDVGDADLHAGGSLFAEAHSEGTTDIHVKAVNGALASATTSATLDQAIDMANEVQIGSGANLRTVDGEGSLVLAASSEDNFAHEALTRFAGGLSFNTGSRTTVDYNRTNRIGIASDARVLSGGELQLLAGKSASGDISRLEENNRAEVFVDAFVAGPEANLSVTTDLVDSVDIAGYAGSVTSASVTADSGYWVLKSDSLSHYWGSLGSDNSVDVAVKGEGKKVAGLTEVNELNVSGTLEAGVYTKADIVIDGVFNADGSDIKLDGAWEDWTDGVKVTAGTEGQADEILAGITAPVLEEAGNVYWERYNELQNLIAEYSASGGEALVAYKAELEALKAVMIEEGYAVANDKNGTFEPISSREELTINVSGISVSGGTIHIDAESVKGSGTISANAAEGITITNNSNANLAVSDVNIYEKGGEILLNGALATDETFANAGFTGTHEMSGTQPDPTITIVSQYKGQSFADGDYLYSPQTSITVTGTVANHAAGGGIKIDAVEGDLFSMGTISAAGDLKIHAGGTITQTYHSGVTNIGSNPEESKDLEDEIDKIQNALENTNPDTAEEVKTSYSNDLIASGGGSEWVAGGTILISGDLLNLNGLIQSGYAEYEINLTEAELQAKIDAITAAWKAAGSPANFDVKSSLYEIQKGGADEVKNDDGTTKYYKYQVACWYDPVNGRIVLDDIVPEGGDIYISGKVASTGGGKILAVDGAADVTIDAAKWSVLTGDISTGNASGRVQITDLFYAEGDVSAIVTTYEGGKAESYKLDKKGDKIADSRTDVDASVYSPKDGLLYVWTEGKKVSTETVQQDKYEGSWWGADDPDWQHTKTDGPHTEVKNDVDLTKGGTITDQVTRPNMQGSDSNFFAWTDTSDYNSVKTVETDTWTSGLFGFYKHKLVTTTTKNGWSIVGTYTVKADQDVTVGTLSGTNTISIASGKDVLLGGSLSAQGGTVNLNAGGSILSTNSSNAIAGASNVNLTATGSIGEFGNAIRLTGGTGTLNLKASAGSDLYIDGTGLGDNRTVSASLIEGAGTVSVAVRDDLDAAKIRGTDISLSSTEGGITVDDLVQTEKAGATQRFDVEARGDVDVTVTEGDLGLGLIETAGDVTLTLKNGTLFDAGDEDETVVSNEDRIESWIAAGIINEDGSSTADAQHAADIEAAEAVVEAEYGRYAEYLKYLAAEDAAPLEGTLLEDYTALAAKYEGCTSAEEAVAKMAADETSDLYKIKTTERWTAWTEDDLLYSIADTIVNGTATPDTGAANIIAANVTINTPDGAVGTLGSGISGSLAADSANRLEVLKYLSQADVGDFTVANGIVTVQLKKPVTVGSTGSVSAEADGNIFLETPAEGDYGFNVGRIVSTAGDVRLTSGHGIAADGATGGFISGNTVTLRGGVGAVGSADGSIRIDASDWAAVSSETDIYIAAETESGEATDMTVYSIASDGDVHLSAENLYAYTGEPAEGYEDFADLGYIRGENLYFDVSGNFGTAQTALRVGSTSNVFFNDSIGNLYLHAIGSGTLDVNGINASGTVEIDADDAIAVGSADAEGGILGTTISVEAENDITVAGDVASTGESGSVLLDSAAGSVEVAEGSTVSAEGDVTIDAGDEVFAGGSVTGSNIEMTAENDVEVKGDLNGTAADGRIDVSSAAGSVSLIEGARVTAAGGAEIKAAQAVEMNKATVDAGTFTAEAGTDLSAAGLQTDVEGEVTLTAGAGMTVDESSNVKGGSVAATAVNDLEASDSRFEATDGDLNFTSTEGAVNLNRSTLIATGALHAHAATDLKLVSSVFDVKGGLDLKAGTGDLDLTGSTGLKSEYIDLEAGKNVIMANAEAAVEDRFTAKAGESVIADGLDLTVGTKADGTPGDVLVTAEKGNVELTGATFTGTTGSLGSVEITAGTDARLEDLFAAKKNFTAEDLAVEAGKTVALGTESLGVKVTEESLTIKGETLEGEAIADGSTFEAAKNLELDFESNLSVGERFTATADTIRFTSNDFTAEDGTTIRGDASAKIDAAGGVSLSGDTLLTANGTVDVAAESGAIDLAGSVTVGDESVDENSASVTLTAKGDIHQSIDEGDGGVRGSSLTASSEEGSVILGAGRDESIGSAGNAFSEAEVDAAGDVIFSSSGRDTLLTVNADRNGHVDGDLKVYGEENGYKFTNGITVAGHALIDAAAVHGESIEAEGALEIVAAHYDDSVESGELSGIEFTGPLSGDYVTLISDNGSIRTGEITSTEGFVDVYRLGTEAAGDVVIGGGSSAATATFFNGRGGVSFTGDFTAANTAYSLTGNGGKTFGEDHLESLIHKAGVVDEAEPLTETILEELRQAESAEALRPGDLPHLDFSAPALETADTDRISPAFFFSIDTLSPTDAYFFLNLRPDADASKADDADEEDRVLEEGLPGHPGGIIRDLREKVDPMPAGWILSLGD